MPSRFTEAFWLVAWPNLIRESPFGRCSDDYDLLAALQMAKREREFRGREDSVRPLHSHDNDQVPGRLVQIRIASATFRKETLSNGQLVSK